MISYQNTRKLPLCLRPDDAGANWREPLDVRDLATRLETEGVTDAVAAAEFGFESTWSMAESWMPRITGFLPPAAAPEPAVESWKEYWKGISFSLPLLFASLAMLLLGFSFWGGDISTEEATAGGVGTVASFLLTGGVVQAMSRRGLFYCGTKQFRLCAESNRWWIRLGLTTVLTSNVVALAASTYWEWMPFRLNLIALAFCMVLSTFWMAAGTLQMAGRSDCMAWLTLGGIRVVAALHRGLGWPLMVSQSTAIALASSAGFLLSTRTLRDDGGQTRVPSGPSWKEAFLLWPYFVYGIFYFGLLFGDRLLAWTAGTYATSLGVMFRGDYE